MQAPQPRYSVAYTDPGMVEITDRRTDKTIRYDIRNFVYGQMMYDERTEKYPNYVHHYVWKLDRIARQTHFNQSLVEQ